MKKSLFFAFALVASVLAFVSCDKDDKKKDEPSVVVTDPIVATWGRATDDSDFFYTFSADGKYQRIEDYYMNGRNVVAHEHIVADGSYKIEGDILTAKIDTIRISMDGGAFDPFPGFWPDQESMKFKIEGNKLSLIRDYGTTDEWTEVLTKKGSEEDTLKPSDFIGTMWRIDSCLAGGEKQRPPHGLIRVLNGTQATFDNDTAAYSFQDGKLVFNGNDYVIAGVKKGWAHLQARGTDIYLCQLPALDQDDMIMPPTAADFVGTWKHAYYVMDSHSMDGSSWYLEGSNPWVETWEFKEDGTCIYTEYFSGTTQTGTWSYDYGILFLNNPLASMLVDENDRITVQPLTKNWFQILRGTTPYPGSSTTEYKYWWFYRVQ